MIFYCIADKESSLGFKLSGIETRETATRQEALDALQAARVSYGVGVILITSRIYALIKEEVEELMYKTQFPLILEIPSRGETKKSKGAGDLLKELMGISV